MSTLPVSLTRPAPEVLAVEVHWDEHNLIVDLSDGRTISLPLAWYPRLFDETPEQRNEWRFIADGEGIHWPRIDEDLSVAGLLRGNH